MARFDVKASRRFGQHFVAAPEVVRHMASLSGVGSGDHVLEIGAGLGSLTLALAETGASVLAVEIDEKLVAALRYVMSDIDADVRIVKGDALNLDFSDLLSGAECWHMVANLPYNIATTLVIDLLDSVPAVKRMLVMLQRETAERLAAPPGSKARGIPSVLIERHATAKVVSKIPASVFVPSPVVESALVLIKRHVERHDFGCSDESCQWPTDSTTAHGERHRDFGCSDESRQGANGDLAANSDELVSVVDSLVRTAFGQRRKMLRRSLAGAVTPQAFVTADVDPTARPEMLTLQQWEALAVAMQPLS